MSAQSTAVDCQYCNRGLKASKSIARGCGDKCAQKYGRALGAAGTGPNEVAFLATYHDECIDRFLTHLRGFIRHKNKLVAKNTINRARAQARAINAENCAICHGGAFVSETQDTGAPGASYTALVPCECQTLRFVADADDAPFCEECLSSECTHAISIQVATTEETEEEAVARIDAMVVHAIHFRAA